MKKFINILGTVFFIVIVKGCFFAPIYLTYAPIVTAYHWGFSLRHLRMAIPFEYRSVWHTLRNDWRDGCEALFFNLAK